MRFVVLTIPSGHAVSTRANPATAPADARLLDHSEPLSFPIAYFIRATPPRPAGISQLP